MLHILILRMFVYFYSNQKVSLLFLHAVSPPSLHSILPGVYASKIFTTVRNHDLISTHHLPTWDFYRMQSAKVLFRFDFRFFGFSYLSEVRCFFSRDLLAFSLRRFHKLARSDILEGTRKLHCVEQTGVTSNTNLLLTKFKFIDRVKNSGGSIESFQAGIYRYIVYTVLDLYRHLVCGGRPITHRNEKISNPKEILIGRKRRYNFKLFITSNLHLHFLCLFVSFFLSESVSRTE